MKCKLLLNIILFVLLIVPTLLGQVFSEITIYGVVTDSLSGEALAGVFVEAINEADSSQRASSFTDENGHYQLNLATDIKGQPDGGQRPSEFALYQNFPNPFNPSTRIRFQLPHRSQVQIIIYNMLGQKVRTLLKRELGPDNYTVDWDGTSDAGNGVAAGIYFYQLRTTDYVETRKMVLLDGHGGSSTSPNVAPLQREILNRKPSSLLLTIRAISPRIRTRENRHVSVSTSPLEYDISVECLPSLFNLPLVNVSELSNDGYVYIGGFPGAVLNEVDSTITVVIKNPRLNLNVSGKVNPDGSFPLLRLMARSDDLLTMLLRSEGQPISVPEEFRIPELDPPIVLFSKPTNGDKDIILDVIIRINFSEPVDTASVTGNSFFLIDSVGIQVPATIGFWGGDTAAFLDPDDSLMNSSVYTIIVTTDLTDLQGLHQEEDFIAVFSTINSGIVIPDFQVNDNSGISGAEQSYSSISYDDNGNFVITWQDERNGDDDIYFQRYDSNGNVIGSNIKVNDDTGGPTQSHPSITMDHLGNFVIVWWDRRNSTGDIYGQRYSSDGSPLGDNFRIKDVPEWPYPWFPAVAMDSLGYFVVTWADRRTGTYDIYAQAYSIEGNPIGDNFKVNDDSGTESQLYPQIASTPNGYFVITWTDYRSGNSDVYSQRLAYNGNTIGSNFKVNDDLGTSSQLYPSTTWSENGNFVITWVDSRNGESDIYLQRYAFDGSMIGTNFKVNSDTGSTGQYYPSIASDENGNFVITWHDYRNGNTDIYAQRFSGDGTLQGTNFQLNDDQGNASQRCPSIAKNSSGNFGITWQDQRNGDYDIYVQRCTSDGNFLGTNFKVNNDQGGVYQDRASISTDNNGNFVITWEDGRNSNYDVYAQCYSSDGTALDLNFKVNDEPDTTDQRYPVVSRSNSGNFVITWYEVRDLYDYHIYAQRFSSDGYRLGSNFRVNEIQNTGTGPCVFTDGNGNFIITWDGNDIYAQRYANDGTPLGSNFQVNDPGSQDSSPVISVDYNGNFIIVWSDWRNGNEDIYAQYFTYDGSPLGTNFRVNDDLTTEEQESPAIAIDGNGHFMITWGDRRSGDWDIYMQRYVSDGLASGSNFKVNGDLSSASQMAPSISADNLGNFIIAWWDQRNGNYDIYAQRFTSDGSPLGQNFVVTNTVIGSQYRPDLKLWNRKIYTVWSDNRIGSSGYDIWANVLTWFR